MGAPMSMGQQSQAPLGASAPTVPQQQGPHNPLQRQLEQMQQQQQMQRQMQQQQMQQQQMQQMQQQQMQQMQQMQQRQQDATIAKQMFDPLAPTVSAGCGTDWAHPSSHKAA